MKRFAFLACLGVSLFCLLDLTTSVPVHPAYLNDSPLQRSAIEFAFECVLSLPFLLWTLARVPQLARNVARVPMPHVAKKVLFGVLFVQCGFIGFKQELFPFTHVGMYSMTLKSENDTPLATRFLTYGIRREGVIEPLSFTREGNYFFRKYLHLGLHDACIALFNPGTTAVNRYVYRACEEEGLGAPVLVEVHVDGAGRVTMGAVEEVPPESDSPK
ncbi:MAG: hypothetical protein GC168_21265 [Candidatus Hydrogenedens sp.]|nr:hypothetical protein [Candidatus Hydrogenedens sp.]